MSDVDEAVRSMGGTAAATLQLTMTLVEQHARRRAERLRQAAAESERARENARAALRVDADVQAARWAALSNTDANWSDGYTSAVEWRELDPRAAAAAEGIEESMRAAGVTVPDSSGATAANRDSLVALECGARLELRSAQDHLSEAARKDVGERAPESSGALGVEVSVQAADEVELGWKSHPQPLNPAGRRQRPAVPGRPRGRSVSQQRRHPRERGRYVWCLAPVTRRSVTGVSTI